MDLLTAHVVAIEFWKLNVHFHALKKLFLEATADPRFYLEEQNGKLGCKTDHTYYYQLQAQMSYSGAKIW